MKQFAEHPTETSVRSSRPTGKPWRPVQQRRLIEGPGTGSGRARRHWPLSIYLLTHWSFLIFGVVLFGYSATARKPIQSSFQRSTTSPMAPITVNQAIADANVGWLTMTLPEAASVGDLFFFCSLRQ
jgi:hypothetical protein